MKRLIVTLLCMLALQSCAITDPGSFADPAAPQPIITMTPGSWR